MRSTVGKFLRTAVLGLAVSGCATATVARTTPVYPTERTFPTPYEQVWEASLGALADHPILVAQKDSGLITTDWVQTKTANPSGALTGERFVPTTVAHEMGKRPTDMRYRLNVLVRKLAERSTWVQVSNHSEIRHPVSGIFGDYSWKPISSETVIEHTLLERIQSGLASSETSR